MLWFESHLLSQLLSKKELLSSKEAYFCASRLHLLRLGGVTHDEGQELGLDTFWTHVFDLRHSPSLPSILALGLVLLSSGGDQKRNSPLWSR
jgi:hypothetical protein